MIKYYNFIIQLSYLLVVSSPGNTLSYILEASLRAAYYYELGDNINNTIEFKQISSSLFRSEYYESIETNHELVDVIKNCVFMKRGYAFDHLTHEMHDRIGERLAETLITHETAGEAQFFKVRDPGILPNSGFINAPCALAIRHRTKVLIMQAQIYPPATM